MLDCLLSSKNTIPATSALQQKFKFNFIFFYFFYLLFFRRRRVRGKKEKELYSGRVCHVNFSESASELLGVGELLFSFGGARKRENELCTKGG